MLAWPLSKKTLQKCVFWVHTPQLWSLSAVIKMLHASFALALFCLSDILNQILHWNDAGTVPVRCCPLLIQAPHRFLVIERQFLHYAKFRVVNNQLHNINNNLIFNRFLESPFNESMSSLFIITCFSAREQNIYIYNLIILQDVSW